MTESAHQRLRWRTHASFIGIVFCYLACMGAVWVHLFQRAETEAPLEIQPAVVDLGMIDQNREYLITVQIRNPSGRDVQVLGARSSCGCLASSDFPVTVAAGASQDLVFTLHSGVTEGDVLHHLSIFDERGLWSAQVSVSARVCSTVETDFAGVTLG